MDLPEHLQGIFLDIIIADKYECVEHQSDAGDLFFISNFGAPINADVFDRE